MVTPAQDRGRMLLAVWLVAFVLRALNTQALLADPLFYNPLGGNAPYLLLAERVAGGALLPDGAFTVNSPLYAYILAAIYKAFGVGSLYAARLVAAAADSGTCVLVAVLAERHFGRVAGWSAGLLMAAYRPSIFFAGEIAPVPYTLFLLTLSILLLDGKARWWSFAAAGVALGLATGTRPNLLLAGLMALGVPVARSLPRARRLAGAVALGLVVGLAPVALLNLAASGSFTLLTLSGGHNLYIGHNPAAQPQYTLPAALDGDIFQTMKELAEEVEGRALRPEEVSSYYTRRAVAYMVRNPGREASLTAKRALMLVNDFEATTYANIDYQGSYSPVLRWTPTFAWLLALALPGMLLIWSRGRFHLWIPFIVATISVLGFFYIARLRIVMIPTLAVSAGAAVARVTQLWRSSARRPIAIAAALALLGFTVAEVPLLRSDPSNDWNKAGGVLRVMGRYAEAETALERARTANPRNPNTYLNLAVLYRVLDRTSEADAAAATADSLQAAEEGQSSGFLEAVRQP